jgi:hypothetical protein
VGFPNFVTHFMDEALSQDVAHINNILLLGGAQVALGILFSCVARQPFYLTRTIPPFFSFLSLLANFDKKIMQVCGDIMGQGSWEFIQSPLVKC